MTALRNAWNLPGGRTPGTAVSEFWDGVDGCVERVVTATPDRYLAAPDWCSAHHLRMDVEVAR